MNREDYHRVVGNAHAVRLMARNVAFDDLDAAIALAATDGPTSRELGRGERMVDDEVLLRTVRMLARLGRDEILADGESASPPPVVGAAGESLPSRSDAPPSAEHILAGEEIASEPRSGQVAAGANGSRSGSDARRPSPVASDPGAQRLRTGPAAS